MGPSRRPWDDGVHSYVPVNGSQAPEGGTADADGKHPLTLPICAGRPLGGVVIDDRVIRRALVRDELPSGGGVVAASGPGQPCHRSRGWPPSTLPFAIAIGALGRVR